MRGAGEARSSPNLCDGLCARGAAGRGLRLDHGPPAVLFSGWALPGTGMRLLSGVSCSQVSLEPQGRERAAASRGRSRHGKPAAAPSEPDPGFRADRGPGPKRPAPQMAVTVRAGLERQQPVAETGGDLSAGDKQAINSGAKFPSARPADNRSRARPRGQPRHLLPLPRRRASTPTFLHTRGCKDTRAAC